MEVGLWKMQKHNVKCTSGMSKWMKSIKAKVHRNPKAGIRFEYIKIA
jgi:hypothetical protein